MSATQQRAAVTISRLPFRRPQAARTSHARSWNRAERSCEAQRLSVAPSLIYRQLICTRTGAQHEPQRAITTHPPPLYVLSTEACWSPHVTARSLTSHLSPPTIQFTPSHLTPRAKGSHTQPSPAQAQPHRPDGRKKKGWGTGGKKRPLHHGHSAVLRFLFPEDSILGLARFSRPVTIRHRCAGRCTEHSIVTAIVSPTGGWHAHPPNQRLARPDLSRRAPSLNPLPTASHGI